MAATWTSWISDLRRSTEAIEEENTLSSSISVVESVVKTHEDSTVGNLQNSLNKLHSERKSLYKIQEEIASIKRKQDIMRQEIQAMAMPSSKDIESIKDRNLFADASGLRYEVNNSEGGSNSTVSMIFSKVDSEKPEREFKVTLDVEDKTKKWMLISVTPHIEGLLSLVDELNSCNDLYQFARSVRMQFKDLVKKLPS